MLRDSGVNARSSPFQPGEGPSRGLLRDYEPSDGTFSSTRSQPRNWPKLIRHNEATDTFVAAEIGNSAAHSDG